MPCAAGEPCQLPDLTPVAPVGHVCHGECGERLHGICGEVVTDNENHRICGACFDASQSAKGGKRKEPAPPAPKGGGTTPPNLQKKAKQGTRENEKRTRLTLDQKVEVVGMLDRQLSQKHIAITFDCGERTVRQIKKERKKLLEEHQRMGAAQGGTKTKREGGFPEAKTLPMEMEAKLTMSHGKPPASIITPAVKALEDTLNNVRVYEAAQRGSPADDLRNLLAALNITPGKPANQDAIQAAQVWATVEDQADVVEAMRKDAAQDIVEHLAGTSLDEGDVSDPEEVGGDESAKPGKLPPPAYAEVSTHFGALERAAEESGNGEAALYLSRAKMAMLASLTSKPSRQSDMRELF